MLEEKSQAVIIDPVPFALDLEALRVSAHAEAGDELDGELCALAERASAAARPRALLLPAELLHREDGGVASIGGMEVESALLDMNLSGCRRVAAYVGTCGRELDRIDTDGDPLAEFWLDCIRMQAVKAAVELVTEEAKRLEGWKKAARMNPGSLSGWPITAQRGLFALLGGEAFVREAVGVELTESFLMRPLKSVSGLIYPTERDFENCMLCPRAYCIGRRAPFDAALAMEYGEYSCKRS